MSANNEELQEILDGLDFQGYLDAAGVDYRIRPGSSGRQINIRECPSCGKTSWKVYANEESGLGNCFSGSCDLGKFNKWKFIKTLHGGPNVEVVKHIKEIASRMGWRPKRKAAAVDYDGDVKLPHSIELPDDEGNNLAYLEDRGVTAEMARYFGLRFCYAGTYRVNERSLQDYSNRVIIPVFCLEGKIRTFQGRDITGTADPKYLFPPGLQAAGRYLYNGHNAWTADHVVVGEGAFDVMAIHAACQGDPNFRHIAALGTFGMHMSDNVDGNDQLGAFLSLKEKRLKRVTIMWDSERDALKAAQKAALRLAAVGLSARVAILPRNKDPNEVSADVVRACIESAVDPGVSEGSKKLMRAILMGS